MDYEIIFRGSIKTSIYFIKRVKPGFHMAKFLLEHNRPDCIGCGACAAVAPEFWEMNDDGKSDITEARDRTDSWQEREIEEKDFENNRHAAESCPVNVIHLKNRDTGEKII